MRWKGCFFAASLNKRVFGLEGGSVRCGLIWWHWRREDEAVVDGVVGMFWLEVAGRRSYGCRCFVCRKP